VPITVDGEAGSRVLGRNRENRGHFVMVLHTEGDRLFPVFKEVIKDDDGIDDKKPSDGGVAIAIGGLVLTGI
jgi:hypothetical protein